MRRGGEWAPPRTVSGRGLDSMFEAVVDAAEEAVLNSMLSSPTVVGRGGNRMEGTSQTQGGTPVKWTAVRAS